MYSLHKLSIDEMKKIIKSGDFIQKYKSEKLKVNILFYFSHETFVG